MSFCCHFNVIWVLFHCLFYVILVSFWCHFCLVGCVFNAKRKWIHLTWMDPSIIWLVIVIFFLGKRNWQSVWYNIHADVDVVDVVDVFTLRLRSGGTMKKVVTLWSRRYWFLDPPLPASIWYSPRRHASVDSVTCTRLRYIQSNSITNSIQLNSTHFNSIHSIENEIN